MLTSEKNMQKNVEVPSDLPKEIHDVFPNGIPTEPRLDFDLDVVMKMYEDLYKLALSGWISMNFTGPTLVWILRALNKENLPSSGGGSKKTVPNNKPGKGKTHGNTM